MMELVQFTALTILLTLTVLAVIDLAALFSHPKPRRKP
jgi:hypothetical protein